MQKTLSIKSPQRRNALASLGVASIGSIAFVNTLKPLEFSYKSSTRMDEILNYSLSKLSIGNEFVSFLNEDKNQNAYIDTSKTNFIINVFDYDFSTYKQPLNLNYKTLKPLATNLEQKGFRLNFIGAVLEKYDFMNLYQMLVIEKQSLDKIMQDKSHHSNLYYTIRLKDSSNAARAYESALALIEQGLEGKKVDITKLYEHLEIIAKHNTLALYVKSKVYEDKQDDFIILGKIIANISLSNKNINYLDQYKIN